MDGSMYGGMPQMSGYMGGMGMGAMGGMGGMGGYGAGRGGGGMGRGGPRPAFQGGGGGAGGGGGFRRNDDQVVEGKLFLGGLDTSTTKQTLLEYVTQWCAAHFSPATTGRRSEIESS